MNSNFTLYFSTPSHNLNLTRNSILPSLTSNITLMSPTIYGTSFYANIDIYSDNKYDVRVIGLKSNPNLISNFPTLLNSNAAYYQNLSGLSNLSLLYSNVYNDNNSIVNVSANTSYFVYFSILNKYDNFLITNQQQIITPYIPAFDATFNITLSSKTNSTISLNVGNLYDIHEFYSSDVYDRSIEYSMQSNFSEISNISISSSISTLLLANLVADTSYYIRGNILNESRDTNVYTNPLIVSTFPNYSSSFIISIISKTLSNISISVGNFNISDNVYLSESYDLSVEYSENSDFSNISNISISSINAITSSNTESFLLDNLSGNTLYYIRGNITNYTQNSTIFTNNIQTMTIFDYSSSLIISLIQKDISNISISVGDFTVSQNIYLNNNFDISIEYSENSDFSNISNISISSINAITSSNTESFLLDNLSGNTLYYIRGNITNYTQNSTIYAGNIQIVTETALVFVSANSSHYSFDFGVANFPTNVFDGNMNTRWSSNGDPNSPYSWIIIDLDQNYDISQLIIHWEAAYATAYYIYTTEYDQNTFTLLHHVSNSNGGTDIININNTNMSGKIKIQAISNFNQYGISIWEITGKGTALGTIIPTFTSSVDIAYQSKNNSNIVVNVSNFKTNHSIYLYDTYSLSVEYSTDSNFSNVSNISISSLSTIYNSNIEILSLSNLSSNTLYYIRSNITNNDRNLTYYSNILTIETIDVAFNANFDITLVNKTPYMITLEVGNITYSNNFYSFDTYDLSLEYSNVSNFGNVSNISISSLSAINNSNVEILSLLNLTANTSYYIRGNITNQTQNSTIFTNTNSISTLTTPSNITPIHAYASFVEGTNYASNAIDGNTNTRWSSYGDPNSPNGHITFVFDRLYLFTHVNVNWEAAYASQYKLQIGNTATNIYSDVITINKTNSSADSIDLKNYYVNGDSLRILGQTMATIYVMSIWEVTFTAVQL